MAITTAPSITTRYDMQLVGKPSTTSATAKAFAAGGPLMVAQDHVLAVMLPDALDRTSHAPHIIINTTDMHGACVGGLLFDPTAAALGVHLAVKPARWAALLQAVDDSGFNFEPIRGEAKVAWPRAALLLGTLPGSLRAGLTCHIPN